jgi:hypothetical protein
MVILFLLVLIWTGNTANAQDDLADFLIADPEDAELLTTDYLRPLDKGFGYTVNSGWYNSARAHSMGFDLTIKIGSALIPDKAKFTSFVQDQYRDLELLSPADKMVPTVFGSETINPEYRVVSSGETFEGPSGNSLKEEFGYDALLFPMLQLGVGVIPNTDIKLRFMPLIEFDDDLKSKMWGVGIMHNINNYFPSGDELLVDLALFAGFTKIDSEIHITETFPGDDQLGVQGLTSWTIDGLISYQLSVLTFYGGIGYNEVISNIDLLGTYDIGKEVLKDPIDAKTRYSGIKASFGLRIKVLVFSLHGEYTFNDYNVLTAGFGLNVN